jgi:ATP-dependent DNA helicase RecQ
MYEDILREYWGYSSFRGIQEEIITSIASGKDTLGLMPTGGGKSITFQVPALAKEGLCLVITPLIALMKDQVQNLRRRNIKALAIYSGMSRNEIVRTLENCIFGDYKFLYISPERLDTEIFRIKVTKMNVSMITVDESHCISQWGYDFRPAYLKIAEIRNLLPDVPVLALTATATPAVVKDIQLQLHFKAPNVFRMSFERKNLSYVVRNTENKRAEMLHILQRVEGSAIVYTRNRQRTKEIVDLLKAEGVSALFYHAGLDDAVRDLRQHDWQTGKARVIVATNAFGMGIDKPDVRLVIHYDLPDSIEAYFQEAGRAGRDGQQAYAVLLCSKSDAPQLRKRVEDTFPPKEYILQVYEHLQYYFEMAMGDGLDCIKAFDFEDFCRKFKHFPVRADSALRILTQAGYLEYTDVQHNASRLLFTVRRDEMYRLRELSGDAEQIVKAILRHYSGVFANYIHISEDFIAVQCKLTRQQVYEQLIYLDHARVLDYIPRKKTPYIIYTRERIDISRIHLPATVYEERKKQYAERIDSMIEYVTVNDYCRSRMLLRYFGERHTHNCRQCDVCRKGRTPVAPPEWNDAELRRQILFCLAEKPQTPAAIAHRLDSETGQTADAMRRLIEDKEVMLENGMLYKLNKRTN